MGRVLLAEDEAGVRTFLRESLERDGHEVVEFSDGLAALEALRRGGFDVVVTDLRMPGADGMTLLRAARTEQPDVEILVLTAHGAVATAVEAMKLGAFDYLEKPLSGPAAIREQVAKALARRTALIADEAPAPPPAPAGGLTFGAPSMIPVVKAIDQVARTAATVLLLGESGTGKEVMARAIHERSPRAQRPFIAINCAVLSENLLDSELFGHERGAFTGAHTQRRGRLELADGGTFFLDEVAELHPSLQAKLLRVLEERSFTRVGGSAQLAVDVRLIAATNRDLKAMIRAGTFREDLYHRLAVFPVRLPPLAERREDIVPLAQHILHQLARQAERATPTLTAAAQAALTSASFSGNVRELRNVLERALIVTEGNVIDVSALALEAETAGRVAGAGSLEEAERQAIAQALAATAGNRREAAARLGIGLRTLYDKLKRYGL